MRITNSMRDEIYRNAAKATFEARQAALKLQENALAEATYRALYPERILAIMNQLPEEYFFQTGRVYVQMRKGSSDYACLSLEATRKVGAIDHGHYNSTPLWCDPPESFVEQIKKLREASIKLESDRREFREKLNQFLLGINTDTRLRELWPEGEEFYKDVLVITDNSLPAVLAETVNQMMKQMLQ